MDRAIPRRERWRQSLKWAVGLIVVLMVVGGGWRWLVVWSQPKLDLAQVIVAEVERGPVTAAIEASGTLVPTNEVVVTAPMDSRILGVLREPGSQVSAQAPIVQLDISALVLEKERLQQALATTLNGKEQAKLRHAQAENERQGALELNALDLRFLETRHRQQQRLFEDGLTSKEALQQAELALEKARVERRQLQATAADAAAAQASEQAGLDLSIQLTRKDLADLEARFQRATAQAPQAGVLTWVNQAVGSAVRSGDVLARIADFSRFKVSASLPDFYAGRLATGQAAKVRVDDRHLPARISRILPAVENGTLQFELTFDNGDTPDLRPNQRVEVFVQTDHRADVLRLRRGPAVGGGGSVRVFVLRGERAEATQVQTGMVGAQYVEILQGLQPGDRVVISQLRDQRHRDVLTIAP